MKTMKTKKSKKSYVFFYGLIFIFGVIVLIGYREQNNSIKIEEIKVEQKEEIKELKEKIDDRYKSYDFFLYSNHSKIENGRVVIDLTYKEIVDYYKQFNEVITPYGIYLLDLKKNDSSFIKKAIELKTGEKKQ